MATKRVIAYYMHESEQAAAVQAMTAPEVTDSFAIGEIDEAQIPALEQQGLVMQVLPDTAPPPPPPTPAPSLGMLATAPAPSFGPRAAAPAPAAAAASAAADAVPAAEDYYTLALRGPLLEPWREQLTSMGVPLVEIVPGEGYKVRLAREQVAAVAALPFVQSVRWISPAQATPTVRSQSVAAGPGLLPAAVKMLTFDAVLHQADDRPTVEQWLRDRNVAIAGSSGRKIRFYALEDASVLADLALLPAVDKVAEYVPPGLFNGAARRLLGLDTAPASPPAVNLTQDGSGQIVAVADTGIDVQHPDFKGRVVAAIALGRAGDPSDPNGHGTHVAGSVLGDGGASGGALKGVAPAAQLYFQSLLDADGRLGGLPLDLHDLFDQAYQAGARIHNNSWGADTASIYTINSEEVDDFARTHPDMLIVMAAGNAGTAAHNARAGQGFVDWLSIGSPASCKNALTVGASRSDRTDGAMSTLTWNQAWPNNFPQAPIGAETISGDPNSLAAFSSRGPCDDHRIKPDLVAPGTDIASTKSSAAPIGNFWGAYFAATGQPPDPHYAYLGGTSMAAPLVSGCAALVRQYYVQTVNHVPSAALLKATLINSTTWLTGTDAVAPSQGRPNYHQGHGRVCMPAAIPNPANPSLALQFVDNWQAGSAPFTRTGERRRYQFVIPAGVPELRFCLAYTDIPARGLQNNLNMIVQHLESGTKVLGNAQLPDALTLPDGDNNVEVVRLDAPAAGTYLVQIFVSNLLAGPQPFALVITGAGVPPLTEI